MPKKLGYISPHVIITRGFIDVTNLSERIQILGLDLFNINIVFIFVKLIGVFSLLISNHSSFELIFCASFFLLSWFHSPPTLLYILIETFTFSCFCCLLELNYEITFKQILFNDYIRAHNIIFKEHELIKNKQINLTLCLK